MSAEHPLPPAGPGRPLAGRRILVTRARHQAGQLAQALEARGAEVLRLATIEIVPPESYAPLDAALRAAQSYQWLVLTSANAVAAIASRLAALQIVPERLAHLRVAAIGSATAEAVRQLGLGVEILPERYVAESVVEALRGKVAGQRVLLARAALARDVIPDELARCGAQVDIVDAYRTVIPPEAIDGVRELLGQPEDKPLPDAVTFTSSSTVTNFLALLQAAGISRPAGLRAVSIGPITTQTLRQQGWEPAVQAAESDVPGVVAACVRLLGR